MIQSTTKLLTFDEFLAQYPEEGRHYELIDDYLTKLAEYEKLSIAEYWIVDYRALGGTRYIGSPKIPTIWVYELAGEEYLEGKPFRGFDQIKSQIFSELELTVEQVLKAGE